MLEPVPRKNPGTNPGKKRCRDYFTLSAPTDYTAAVRRVVNPYRRWRLDLVAFLGFGRLGCK